MFLDGWVGGCKKPFERLLRAIKHTHLKINDAFDTKLNMIILFPNKPNTQRWFFIAKQWKTFFLTLILGGLYNVMTSTTQN